jgi:4-amino-4-deoxy-L-arabinose transferase-like glycosyltransferase
VTSEFLTRRRAAWIVAAITVFGGVLRFYNLAWGAPYYHFHIDEHFVLGPADSMYRSVHEAAMWPKFFMYSPLLMYLTIAARYTYETLNHPLNLSIPKDAIVYTVLGRMFSASFGTATIAVVYLIARRLSGRLAGVLAAALVAFTVIHVRDSHFAATDVSLTFACALTLLAALRLVDRPTIGALILAGLGFGLTIALKYSGAFVLGVVGVAYLLAPGRPVSVKPMGAWIRWALRGVIPIPVGIATFLAIDPLVLMYPHKFRTDIKEWVIDPLTGVSKPIWTAQFADIAHPQLYWFTNLLWWGLGPALEIAGIVGVFWLIARRDRRSLVAASFPILYYAAAGLNNRAPMLRYIIPLVPAVSASAAVMCADWIERGRQRTLAVAVTIVLVGSTAFYGLAYMNVFRQPDARLAASKWLVQNVPKDTKILVEPSQNTPPMGSYFRQPDFYKDNMRWADRAGGREDRDYYDIFTIDMYRFLYNQGVSDEARSAYIKSRLALADYIVIDDTFLQFYQHLPESTHRVPKQYYDDLFAGRLGFAQIQTFKVYPSLFGVTINDDTAELSFRLFDHPRVYIFRRVSSGD